MSGWHGHRSQPSRRCPSGRLTRGRECKAPPACLVSSQHTAGPPGPCPAPAPTWPPAEGRGEAGVVDPGLLLSEKLHGAAPAAQLAAGGGDGAAGGPVLWALRRAGAVVACGAVGAGGGALGAAGAVCGQPQEGSAQQQGAGGLGGQQQPECRSAAGRLQRPRRRAAPHPAGRSGPAEGSARRPGQPAAPGGVGEGRARTWVETRQGSAGGSTGLKSSCGDSRALKELAATCLQQRAGFSADSRHIAEKPAQLRGCREPA